MDQAFDDPIRKQAPREEAKKEVEEVSTEKSSKGLAEIYEDEYMLQMHNYDKKKDELDKKKVVHSFFNSFIHSFIYSWNSEISLLVLTPLSIASAMQTSLHPQRLLLSRLFPLLLL